MINQEILNGLRSAMLRGDTLKEAMISFYNSGYKKEDIENAARNLNLEEIEKEFHLIEQEKRGIEISKEKQEAFEASKKKEERIDIPKTKTKGKKKISGKKERIPKTSKKSKKDKQKTPKEKVKGKKTKQRVSAYGKKSNLAIILLVFILLLLIGALIALFVFKDKIINLF